MGKENKKKKKSLSQQDYRNKLIKIKKLLAIVKNQKEIETLKLALLKLFEASKNNPALQDFEPFRITLFKSCNLNLQFLNLNEDVWELFSQGKIEDSYNLILKGVRTMNNHPDREYLYDWVREKIQNTLERIADIATSNKKQQSPLITSQISQKQDLNSDTIMNPLDEKIDLSQNSNQTIQPNSVNMDPIAPLSSTQMPTIFPNRRKQNATIKPLKSSQNEITMKLTSNQEFETLFKPQNFSEQQVLRTPENPFKKKGENEEVNPIHTYWIRNQNIKKQIQENSTFPKKKNKEKN
ncbi:hypothetical protein [Candidatus Harpocratesius sp.]